MVLKFGGTSVSSFKKWQTIVGVVKERIEQGHQVLVVHSAAQGLTNLLTKKISKNQSIYDEFISKITDLAAELSAKVDLLEQHLTQLKSLNELPKLSIDQQAELLALGEQCTHVLIMDFLTKQIPSSSLDPKQWLISSNQDKRSHESQVLSAKCDISARPDVNNQLSDPFYVMPGFIASDESGNTVLLGRGGSDTSAAYMAVLLSAKQLEIWTDVHGIFSANPHSIPNARLLLNLGYQEAREIAASGGKVLHPRCILPLEQNDIPLMIKNTNHPTAQGTVLASQHSAKKPRVSAINSRHQVTLVSMESMNMWHQAGFMGDVFNIYKKLGLSIDLVSTAQTNITISLDNIDNILNPEI